MSEETKYPVPTAGAFIFNKDNKLFLMKSPGWGNKYTCPGGKIEIGETVIETAKREIKEETNLDIKDVEIMSIYDAIDLKEYIKDNGPKHMIFINTIAKVEKENVKLDNREGTEYKWLSIDEWLKKDKKEINSYTLRFIKEIKERQDNNWEDKYKRALADQQNLIKQTTNEKQEFYKYATESILQDILPVYDNLKVAVNSIKGEKDNPWVEGIKYVIKQFKDVLESNGLEEIETVNKKFDHHTMEAVEGKGKKVIKEVKPGYKLKGKVIIPAKVILDNK